MWAKEIGEGKKKFTAYSVSLQRSYMDDKDEWQSTHFYRQSHGRIYAAMLAIVGRGEPLDVVTVAHELERASGAKRPSGRGATVDHLYLATIPRSHGIGTRT